MALNTTSTFQINTAGPLLNSVDGNGVIWRVNQDGVVGWDGEPGTTLTPVQKPRSPGAWVGTAFTTGRTVSITGTIMAPTAALLNTAIDSLKNAVTSSDFPITRTNGSGPRWQTFRRQGETIVTKVTNLYANYSIQVFAAIPRMYGVALTGTTFLPASSGGLTWGHAWPETWPATTISGTVSLTNPGNAAGPVVLRIDGPAGGPQIAHTSSANASIVTFSSSLVLGAGEWLTVNMQNRQALANDQSNRAAYITNRGWSAFDPGVNTWSFSASSYNALSLLTVTATPAYK